MIQFQSPFHPPPFVFLPSINKPTLLGMNATSLLNRVLPKKPQPTTTKALTHTILTHLKANQLQEAVSILFSSPLPLNHSLYAHLLHLCSVNGAIVEARKVESHLISSSLNPPTFLLNRVIETYGKCGCLDDAQELFDEMPHRDGGSWNALISGYTQCGTPENALALFKRMNREGVLANEVTLASVLGSCADILEVFLGMQVHGVVLKRGFLGNVVLGCSLVDVYGKCGGIGDARRVFDEIEFPNEVTWNVIVRRYLEASNEGEAVVMFSRMIRAGVRPLSFTFSNALVACSRICALTEGMQIHGGAVKIGFEDDVVVSSSLINMYVKCGELEIACMVFDLSCSRDLISCTVMVSAYAMSGRTRKARELFDEMPRWNVVSWNAMLAGYTHSLQWEEALNFARLMRCTTEDIDHVTLGLMLNVCVGISDIDMGRQIHGFMYRHGFASNVFVGNALLDMYGKCGNLKNARVWFTQMSQRDSVSWNALLTSHVQHGLSEQVMMIFRDMQQETKPDNSTFGTLLAAFANIAALDRGKQIHGFMIRNGYDISMVVRGALVDMYSKCGCFVYALMLFRAASFRDIVLWNSIIFGCSHHGMAKEALKLFALMEDEGIKPDHVTFQGLLLACISEGCVELGMQYFNSMNNEYYVMPRLEHYLCMIELFSRHGCMDELESFVKEMPFDPTMVMLTRISLACEEYRCSRLGEWAAARLKELNP